jgi:hypothetical protein
MDFAKKDVIAILFNQDDTHFQNLIMVMTRIQMNILICSNT